MITVYVYDKNTGEYIGKDVGNPIDIMRDLPEEHDFTQIAPPNNTDLWRCINDEWVLHKKQDNQLLPIVSDNEIHLDHVVMGTSSVRYKKITDCIDSTLSQQAFAHGLDANKIVGTAISIVDTDGSAIHSSANLTVRTDVNNVIVFGGDTLMLAYKADITILITYED